jgi:hypothetical protein
VNGQGQLQIHLFLGLAISGLMLTVGCDSAHYPKLYRTAYAAQEACPDDEVVLLMRGEYGLGAHGVPYYQTNQSMWFSGLMGASSFTCLSEVTRFGFTCGSPHDPASGPLPYSVAPQCYNVPDKPKV